MMPNNPLFIVWYFSIFDVRMLLFKLKLRLFIYDKYACIVPIVYTYSHGLQRAIISFESASSLLVPLLGCALADM